LYARLHMLKLHACQLLIEVLKLAEEIP